MLCSECSNRGATIGCCHKDCPSNFHFSCGVKAKADFKEDKTVYCIKHAQKYAAKPNARSFHVDRTVWVDTDPEETVGRKRSKFVDFRELQFSLGSVTYDRLGSLVPASDTKSVSRRRSFDTLSLICPHSGAGSCGSICKENLLVSTQPCQKNNISMHNQVL